MKTSNENMERTKIKQKYRFTIQLNQENKTRFNIFVSKLFLNTVTFRKLVQIRRISIYYRPF